MQTRSKTVAQAVPAVAPVPAQPAPAVAPAPKKKAPPVPAPVPVKRPKGPTPKAKKVVPEPYKTDYTIPEILKIVADWTTESSIKKLSQTKVGMTKAIKDNPAHEKTVHPGVDEFYKEINLKKHPKTTTVMPFIQYQCAKVFDPKLVALEQFTEFVNGLSKWVHDIKYGMHQLESMKSDIKKLLGFYHKGDSTFEFPIYSDINYTCGECGFWFIGFEKYLGIDLMDLAVWITTKYYELNYSPHLEVVN